MQYPQKGDGVVVLLSGGMDSTTLLAETLERTEGGILALTMQYGSKHQDAETQSARAVVDHYAWAGVEHVVRELPSGTFFNSGLIDSDLPSHRSLKQMEESGVAPSYVPMRNTVLLANAGAFADAIGFKYVAYAAHREDHVGYPDCRPEYFTAMSHAMQLGSKGGVQIYDPFIWEGKDKIVPKAHELQVPLHLTHTCYLGRKPACGTCDTCVIRIQAFKDAGYIDPIPYAIHISWGSLPIFS